MTTPDDTPVQVQVGLADTPLGQRIAIIVTALLPKDTALQVADHITRTAGQLSTTRLVVANGSTPSIAPPPG